MRKLMIGLVSLVLLGCAQTGAKNAVPAMPAATVVPESHPASVDLPPVVLPQKVTAVGYGAMPTMEGLSQEQRRILAMRAAKLDAYRALAEVVEGLKITGSSTVSAVVLTNDSFRVYIEAYLRGARVLTTTPLPGGSYETVVELQLGGEFYRDAAAAKQGVKVAVPPPSVAVQSRPAEPVAKTPEKAAAPAVAETKPRTDAKAQADTPSTNFYLAK